MSSVADPEGIAPSALSQQAGSSNGDTVDIRRFLIRFYNIYNPEKVLFVDSILEKYRGSEHILFKQLYDKYSSVLNHNGPDEKMLKSLIEKHNRIQLEQNSKKIISDLSSSFAKGLQQWTTAVQTNLQKEFDIIKTPSSSSSVSTVNGANGPDDSSAKVREAPDDAASPDSTPKLEERKTPNPPPTTTTNNDMIDHVYETLNTLQKSSNQQIVSVSCSTAAMQAGYGLVTIFCLTKDVASSSSSNPILEPPSTPSAGEADADLPLLPYPHNYQIGNNTDDEVGKRLVADTSYRSVLLQSIEKCNNDIISDFTRDESIVHRLKESLLLQRKTNKMLLSSLETYTKTVDERVHEFLSVSRERALFEREDILSHLSLLLDDALDGASLIKMLRLRKVYDH